MRPITELLTQMPDLVAEIEITAAAGAPNPGPRAGRHLRTVPGSRPPLDLDALDALRPDHKGLLALLSEWVRLCAEQREGLAGPLPADQATWTSECRYLAEIWPWADQQPWADEADAEIRQVWKTLAKLNRETPPQRYRCTRCGDRAHMRDGDSWLSCDSGHVIDHRAEIARAMATRPPMTVGQIAGELGVSRDQVKKWITRRGIDPTETVRGVARYDIETVTRTRHAVHA